VEFIFHITVNLNGFQWWWSSVLKLVQDVGFELGYMESRMDPAEVISERNSNGVLANTVKDLEGTKVAFGGCPGGTGSADEFGKDEYFVTGVEWQRSLVGVRGCLVVLLSELEGFCKIEVKFLEIGSEFASLEQGDIVLQMDVQGQVVALVREEWQDTC